MATYTISPSGDVALLMTPAEARGLLALAGEGATGLFEDVQAGRAYIGNRLQQKAARAALDALGGAAARTDQLRRKE